MLAFSFLLSIIMICMVVNRFAGDDLNSQTAKRWGVGAVPEMILAALIAWCHTLEHGSMIADLGVQAINWALGHTSLAWRAGPTMGWGELVSYTIAFAWAYVFIELGHGNAFHDGMSRYAFPDRWQSLDYIVWPICLGVQWVCRLFYKQADIGRRSTWYCRIFMGIKGLLIALPMAPHGLVMFVLWPLAYAICFQNQREVPPAKMSTVVAEWMGGIFLGIPIAWIITRHFIVGGIL